MIQRYLRVSQKLPAVKFVSLAGQSPVKLRHSVVHYSQKKAIPPALIIPSRHELADSTGGLENISKVWQGPLPEDSPYMRPSRLHFVQNGEEKCWDVLKVPDTVAVILFNKTRNTLVMVKQFRPAVYHAAITSAGAEIGDVDLKKFPPKLGVTLELCAGIVDKNKSWIEIAKEEIIEECGYDVPIERIEEVLTFRPGSASSGVLMTIYYCEVTDEDMATSGGGVDDEIIEVVECSLDEARKMVAQGATNNSSPSSLFGILWFLTNKAPKTLKDDNSEQWDREPLATFD